MSTNSQTRLYNGFRLPVDVIEDIKAAKQEWGERDKRAWAFAARAARVVGRYIPDATQCLAVEMGVESPSTPEGYAKAHWLLEELKGAKYLKHAKPLPNLYISHYIVCGKAFYAKVGIWDLDQIDALLQEASKFKKPVEWVRGKFGNVSGADEYRYSVMKQIKSIEAHIINAPYTGVNEYKAVVLARLARVFVRFMRWAIDQRDDPDQISLATDQVNDLQSVTDIILGEEEPAEQETKQ